MKLIPLLCRQIILSSSLQTVIMNSSACVQPSALPSLPQGCPTLHTLHTIFMQCLRTRIHALVIWKNPGNHRLSLVLMKENNSLTSAKTVQNQPFLMSDTSRPPDPFYVSKLINKAAPPESSTRGSLYMSESGRVNFIFCVCVLSGVIWGFWSSHNNVQSHRL